MTLPNKTIEGGNTTMEDTIAAEILKSLSALSGQVSGLTTSVDHLTKKIDGNGSPGLLDRMTVNEQKTLYIAQSVEYLKDQVKNLAKKFDEMIPDDLRDNLKLVLDWLPKLRTVYNVNIWLWVFVGGLVVTLIWQVATGKVHILY